MLTCTQCIDTKIENDILSMPLSSSLPNAIISDITVINTAERVCSFVSDNLCNLRSHKSVRLLWFPWFVSECRINEIAKVNNVLRPHKRI